MPSSNRVFRPALSIAQLRIYGAITRQPGFLKGKVWRDTLFWIVARPNGWLRHFGCGVIEYSPGCIRFTNGTLADCPKSLWPFPILGRDAEPRFELTVHESEATSDIGRQLYLMLLDPEQYVFEWAGFEEKGKIPVSAFSFKGHEHGKATYPNAFKR